MADRDVTVWVSVLEVQPAGVDDRCNGCGAPALGVVVWAATFDDGPSSVSSVAVCEDCARDASDPPA